MVQTAELFIAYGTTLNIKYQLTLVILLAALLRYYYASSDIN